MTVREMINTFQGSAKTILDKAYGKLGLVPQHGITEESVERERLELSTYDYIFASNSLVEASLIEANIKPEKILRSSFGWNPSKLARSSSAKQERATFTALFVGTISVRKGVPQLLEAWRQSGVAGELILAGGVERALKPLLEKYSEQSVRFLDYVPDVGQLYHSADVFVFPTLEEGGPQVSYEAAGCGLPVITTPMGAGRIIKDGINGLIVEANDVSGLAKSLSQIASSTDLRSRLARQATLDAERYAYEKIGLERSMILRDLIDRRRGKR